MGLPTLRIKIANKLEQDNCTEADVIYLLVEISKYLERSRRDKRKLGDLDELKVRPGKYPLILFFRNWAAHTEKDSGAVPKPLTDCFEKIIAGVDHQEDELTRPLLDEIARFADEIQADLRISRAKFSHHLQSVLSEQPVTLKGGCRIGFNADLRLVAW